MNKNEKEEFTRLINVVDKLGVKLPRNLQASILKSLEFTTIKTVDFFPDLVMNIRTIISKERFTFGRGAFTGMEQGLLIFFNNIFDDGPEQKEGTDKILIEDLPNIQILPLHFTGEFMLPKHAHKKQISILISTEYLESFLNKDQRRFSFLFNKENQFFIEEIMSQDIVRVAGEISKAGAGPALPDFYYKLKSLELIYYLFRGLEKREAKEYRQVTTQELKAIYKVRDELTAKLDGAVPVTDLVKIAGMNELKLRKLFTQIFGMGLYDYFQHMRMREAARLLKEGKNTVSEVGYLLGFSNLSHFTRLFEEHTGMKPKKWSMRER